MRPARSPSDMATRHDEDTRDAYYRPALPAPAISAD